MFNVTTEIDASANKEIEFRKLVAVLSLNLLDSIILSTEVLVLE